MRRTLVALMLLPVLASPARGQTGSESGLDTIPGVVWHGRDNGMPLAKLAAYMAPVFWFSPDETSLNGRDGKDITIPETFPADRPASGPVVYFQFNRVLTRPRGEGLPLDRSDPSGPILDLRRTAGFDLSFYLLP